MKKAFDRNISLPLRKYNRSKEGQNANNPFFSSEMRPESKNSTQNSKFSNIIKSQQQLISSFVKSRRSPIAEGETSREQNEADIDEEEDFIKLAK